MSDRTCATCHWWMHFGSQAKDWGLCVWLTGAKGAPTLRIRMGGRKPIATQCTWGCNDWEQDKREEKSNA